MSHIELYTKPWCPYCKRAKSLLDRKGLQYKEINVEANFARESEMIKRSQSTSVPQIFIGETHLGGSDELVAAERSGLLDELLAEHTVANV